MHHTRRTHNAHNETQRRLRKIASCYKSKTPHYFAIIDSYGPAWIEPYWSKWSYSTVVGSKTHGVLKGREYDLVNLEHSKKHSFYTKSSKSNGSKSVYKIYKKTLHKRWRRKGFDEPSYTVKGTRLSYQDYIF